VRNLNDDVVTTAQDAIAAALDGDQLTRLKARGAELDLPSAVIYLRTEVDRILADGRHGAII
jgi:hypothetical protein